MRRAALALVLALSAASACKRPSAVPAPSSAKKTATPAGPPQPDPIRIEVLDPAQVPPAFVMRGGPRGPERLVFLHGMCGHGHGYAQSFQRSAARHGTLISLQADVPCGAGPWAKWSNDLAALDRRVVETFQALGHAPPITNVAVLGYSQGATRAEALARRWPERYTRLVLIGAPDTPSPRGLDGLRGAVMMAGERDRRDQMQRGARAFERRGIPAVFLQIPAARHGEMGPTPELTMGQALDWLWSHSRP